MPSAPPTVAITSTRAMVRAAEAQGFPTDDLLERVSLSRDSLDDPDTRIPGRTALALWELLIERTGNPALQLSAPTALPFGAYRVMDYLVGPRPRSGKASSDSRASSVSSPTPSL